MSAQIWRTHVVLCDHEGCLAQLRSDTLDLNMDATTATVRRIARRRGWQVSVPGARRHRRDYCPEHIEDVT